MSEDPVQLVDTLLERLVSALSGGGAPDGEPTTGSAAEGMVRAVVGSDGHVQSLALDPKLLRTPGQVAPGIVTAVNQAVEAAPEVSTTSSRIEDLKSIQNDSLDMTMRMNASLVGALEALKPE